MNNFFKTLLFILLIFKSTISFSDDTKIKIGVLAPLSGENKDLGQQIINSIRMALIDIDDNKIEIYPKDTKSDPNITLRSALELEKMGINVDEKTKMRDRARDHKKHILVPREHQQIRRVPRGHQPMGSGSLVDASKGSGCD